MAAIQPVFEPNFLNLEYLFNQVLLIPIWIGNLLASLTGGGPYDFSLLEYILWIITLLFSIGIVYCIFKILKIREKEYEHLGEMQFTASEEIDTRKRNERWQKVLDYLNSPSEPEWRLAILEADNILGELLFKMGYHGDTIGEKLKGVEISDFITLSQAWEAHKVRNQIAHEGVNFIFTKREAQRIIDLYRKVFEEFHYI